MNEVIKAAWITGVCAIVCAIIGLISININLGNNKSDYEALKLENMDLQTQLDDLNKKYENILIENNSFIYEKADLQNQIDLMQSAILKYNSLVEENASLKERVQELENELQIVKHTYANELGAQDGESLNNNNDGNSYIQITMESVKIRSAPETSSPMIGGALRGDKILLVNTVDGTNGHKWYEVSVEDQIGYIRSDLARIVE